MRARFSALVVVTTTLAAGIASAQSSYPCSETNANLPNPYRQVADWASPPRPWNPVNAVAVDRHDNLWAVDRCETDDCVPVIELGPDGKTLKNFGAGLFVEPHQAAIDKEGNLWVADAGAKGAKGMQVTKFDPGGRVLLKLGKPGQGAGLSRARHIRCAHRRRRRLERRHLYQRRPWRGQGQQFAHHGVHRRREIHQDLRHPRQR